MKDEIRIEELEAAALPAGFRTAGVACGIKAKGADLALIVSDPEAVAAATFTTNRIQAAPVRFCRAKVEAGLPVRAVIINSGNANACTGDHGLKAAEATAEAAAKALGVPAEHVLVCSTGPIGVPLPVEKIEAGLAPAAAALGADGMTAARAIMTTDTVPKFCSTTIDLDGRQVTLSGLAKGSGMIEPNMATMLAYLLTDAAVEPAALQTALRHAVDASFNRITVDGDRSTNDTVLLLANGASGAPRLTASHPAWPRFEAALLAVCRYLALRIVRDGEGATHLVTIRIEGAATSADAERAARAIANSSLNKTSFAGADPAWGRIIDAVGYSGAAVEEHRIAVWYDDVQAVRGGVAAGPTYEQMRVPMRNECFTVRVDLGLGAGVAEVYTCDFTEQYVRINLKD